jgi:predicted RNA binding protein YcfA (HicA-like mRNA interferase family)/predicted RNase H-like HicB family nuclease
MTVRDVLKRLQEEGWTMTRQKGSHRQFVHHARPGLRVTVAGHPKLDVPKGTLNSIFKQAAGNNMRYAVVIEKSENGFGAYVPDLPGCIAVAESLVETEELIKEAIVFHLEGLRKEGTSVPQPSSLAEYVEV